MSKKLVKLAIIGLAAGTCISGQSPVASANVKSVVGDNEDQPSETNDDDAHSCAGEHGCGVNHEKYRQKSSGNGSKQQPSDQQDSSDQQQDSIGNQGGNENRQKQKIPAQSQNMQIKRKSAAARVVEGK